MRWDVISAINENRAVKALGIWFFVLPVAARILEAEFMRPWLAGVHLPFTWGLLYVAALLFFVSRLLYLARCPSIIKDYSSWADFSHREASFEKIIPLLVAALGSLPVSARQPVVSRMRTLKHVTFRDESGGDLSNQRIADALASSATLDQMLRRAEPNRSALADIFAGTREAVQKARPISRSAIVVVQAIGTLLLLWVAGESTLSVVTYYFSGA